MAACHHANLLIIQFANRLHIDWYKYVEKTHLPNVIVIEYKDYKNKRFQKIGGASVGQENYKQHLKCLRCCFEVTPTDGDTANAVITMNDLFR